MPHSSWTGNHERTTDQHTTCGALQIQAWAHACIHLQHAQSAYLSWHTQLAIPGLSLRPSPRRCPPEQRATSTQPRRAASTPPCCRHTPRTRQIITRNPLTQELHTSQNHTATTPS